MLRFAHPEYLFLLVLVPVILGLFILMQVRKRKALLRLGELSLLRQLSADASGAKPWIKGALLSFAFILLVIGAANPQIGTKLEEVKREGVDIIIALDVSNSMKAEDIRPNRLERAKQAISRLIDQLENDRIGIVVFAGQAYVQLPITSDFGAAKLFLSSIDTDIIPTQGTDIGAAINLSMQSFVGTDNKYKALVIITDGEDNEGTGQEAALHAKESGVIIHTIGMGTDNGAPIPIYNRNGMQVDFLKDENGSIVLSRLDQATLEKIAAEGKGVFVRASNSDDGLNAVMKEISKMDKKAFGAKLYTGYEDRFQYFIGAGLLVLLIEFSMSNRKSKWLARLNLFGEKKMKLPFPSDPFTKRLATITVAFLGMALFCQAQTERELIRSGNKLYKAKKYSEAEIAYRKSLAKNKESVAGQYDLGNAYYKQQKFDEAQSQYSRLLNDKNVSKADKANAYHNLGNSYLESKKFPESIEAYKNSLRLNPKDNDTRYNLAYAQSMLQQQQNQQNQQDNKDKKDKKQDKQKQDQQKQQQKKEEKQQEAAKRENISREDAEKMLQALNNDEKNTQKKLVKKEGTRIQIAKQW